MKIGLQIDSLKNEIAAEGLDAVLEKVAAVGFSGVEFSGFYGYSPLELVALLKKHNLKACGLHFNVEDIIDDTDTVRSYALALDATKVIISNMPSSKGIFVYSRIVKKLTQARDAAQAAGLRIGYHNHSIEFEDGEDYVKDFYDDIEGLNFEIDFFWLKAAGKDCIEYISKIKDRVFLTHLKELSPEGNDAPNPDLGAGTIDAEAVIRFCLEQNYSWTVLEFSKITVPYVEYLERNYNYIKSIIG